MKLSIETDRKINTLIPSLLKQSKSISKELKARIKANSIFNEFEKKAQNEFNFYINDSVYIDEIFDNCKNLTFIDISSFHRSKYDDIYGNLPEKGKIFVSNDYYDSIKKFLPEWKIFIR